MKKANYEIVKIKYDGNDGMEIVISEGIGYNKATELMSDILFNTISYYDYKESFYHAFVAGLMIGAGYIVESNYEKGLGRPDIVVMDKKKRRVILM